MAELLPEAPSPPEESGGGRRVLLLVGVSVAAAALVLFVWLGTARRPAPSAPAHLAFSAVEQSYAPNVRVENVALSRAENYLHQEVTTLQGDLVNSGERSLQSVELTIDFLDEMNQVVLRQSLISSAPQPLAPKGSRAFEVSFEHVPSAWNMQSPVIRVTGLQLAR
ncbi:MAG TPA: FxLYD domain-containing protein [Candidatus Dormibacteraeota bacterium]|nr:FxLYD domain-containing protein [Candidatus Dormibacteraeota bacterium]